MASGDASKDWDRFRAPLPTDEPAIFSSPVRPESTTPVGPPPRNAQRQQAQPAAQRPTSQSGHQRTQSSTSQRPATQRTNSQRFPPGVRFDGPAPESPLALKNIVRSNENTVPNNGANPSRINSGQRLPSRSYDRTISVMDLRTSIEADGNVVTALNQSHAKLINDMARHLAELEIRLDQRTLPIAQACQRLERLRHDMATNQFDSDMELATLILEEFYIVVNRLEDINNSLRSCSNKPACCACQFTAPVQGGETFTLLDHCTGREIQEFVDMHAAQHTTETGAVRAIYQNLGTFFKDILGHFEPDKVRCKSRKGFLSAWRSMTQQPSYLNNLDRELGKIRDQAVGKRARDEHDGKKAKRVSLTGLFNRKDKSDRDSFGSR